MLRKVLPIVLIVIGIAAFVGLKASKPALVAKPVKERSWIVASTPVVLEDYQPTLVLYGEATAGRETDLRAAVAGEVIEVSDLFTDGATVSANQWLATIDPFDYQAALDESKAQLLEAEAKLDELAVNKAEQTAVLKLDKEQLELHKRDLERSQKLRKKGTVSQKTVDQAELTLSKQAQTINKGSNALRALEAKIKAQQAIIARLNVGVRRAERALEDTKVLAPFGGVLQGVTVAKGENVKANDSLAKVIDTERLEARFRLSDSQYGRIIGAGEDLLGRKVTIIWQTGAQKFTYPAVIERVGAEVDATTGGVQVHAKLENPDLRTPLRPGAFLEIQLPDRAYKQVAVLPEAALFDQSRVYVVGEDMRLQERKVTLEGRDGRQVILTGDLKAGEQVVTTHFPDIGPGLLVVAR